MQFTGKPYKPSSLNKNIIIIIDRLLSQIQIAGGLCPAKPNASLYTDARHQTTISNNYRPAIIITQ